MTNNFTFFIIHYKETVSKFSIGTLNIIAIQLTLINLSELAFQTEAVLNMSDAK